MFKHAQYGLLIVSLWFPIITEGKPCSDTFANNSQSKICDVTFSALPTFPNFCIGTGLAAGIYTITNNTPVSLLLNYIQIQSYDGLPANLTAIVPAPASTCGSSIAAGASCNIVVDVLPLAFGSLNRVLQIGIDSRQVQLQGPAITSVVNCTPSSPATPPVPTNPAPTPAPSSLYNVSILGASTVTNAGLSVINGDVDVSPGTAITGFPPGTVVNGSFHAGDPTAATAHTNAANYYNSAEGLTCPAGNNLSGQDLGGKILTPGVYCFNSSAQLTGMLTLSGGPTSAFIFQIGSTLTTAIGSSVVLTGGVVNGNVTWAIGSSATIGGNSAFAGIIDATTSITLNSGAALAGRAWALNGAITLTDNAVNPS